MFDRIRTILYRGTGFFVSDLEWNSPRDGYEAGREAETCPHRYGTYCGCRARATHHHAHWRWIAGHGWWGDDRDGQTEALFTWLEGQVGFAAGSWYPGAWMSVDVVVPVKLIAAMGKAIIARREVTTHAMLTLPARQEV